MSKVVKRNYTTKENGFQNTLKQLSKLESRELGNVLHAILTIEKKRLYLALKPFLKDEFQTPRSLAKQEGFPISHETLYSWERSNEGGGLS